MLLMATAFRLSVIPIYYVYTLCQTSLLHHLLCPAVDPLYRLEHEQADKRRAASRKTVLTQLTELSDVHGRDDYSANARLRQGMRSRKRKDRKREDEAKVRVVRCTGRAMLAQSTPRP